MYNYFIGSVKEMKKFIRWFNNTAPGKPKAIQFAPVRAAIAHLYFESIHPFEDGNGRVGRAIAEKALSQSFGYPAMLSLSQAIEADKKALYSDWWNVGNDIDTILKNTLKDKKSEKISR